MKKLSTIVLLSLLVISCKKEKEGEEEKKINFNGRWSMVSDTARYIDVLQVNDSVVDITFPRKIDTPPQYQGAITLSYHSFKRNDTTFCVSGNIYPGCYFVKKKTFYTGYIAEWTQGPELGAIKEMTRK